MSGITDAKTSIKKISLLIDEINELNKDAISKLKIQPNNVLDSIERLEQEMNTNIKTIESHTNEINTIKNQISQRQRDIFKLEEEVSELTKQREELITRIKEAENDLKKTQDSINLKNQEIENRDRRLKELEEIFQSIREELEPFNEKLKTIEKELKTNFLKKLRFVESFENRMAALKLLINKKYISSWQFQFIRALQKDNTLDLNNILLATDIREDQAKNLLKKMIALNGPIEYDESTSMVTLKREVDF